MPYFCRNSIASRASFFSSICSAISLPEEELLEKAAGMLGLQSEQIAPQIMNLAIDKKLVIKEKKLSADQKLTCIYSLSFYYAELNCARMLFELQQAFDGAERFTAEEMEHLRRQIEQMEQNCHLELDELQRKAVMEAIQNGIFILSGGPGTGKTTTINMIIRYFEQEGMDIFLAAPTGRAAKPGGKFLTALLLRYICSPSSL